MWYYTVPPILLNMTLTGSFIILFVLLARLALKKAPKIYSYALWAVVLFRLLCPVSFSAPISLLGALEAPVTEQHTVEYVSPTVVHDPYPALDIPAVTVDDAINETLPQGQEQLVADPLEAPVSLASLLWLWGMGALLTYSAISLLFLRRKLVGAAHLRENIYLADHIDTPFVMGILRPKIYLPSSLSEGEQGYILLHERHHIRRLDHIWKLLGFAALCIHWFNPLVWLSFVLSGKDMEMSCDEAVLKKMGAEIRSDYSASLLSLATGRPIISGAPLAFGEGDTKSRIKNALKWKEAPAWLRLTSAAACGLIVAFCAANPADEPATAPEPFGHTYRVAEVLYDDPNHGKSFEPWVSGLFRLDPNYALCVREGYDTWLTPGVFQEMELSKENFDDLFLDTPFSGTPADLRKNNKNAWGFLVSENTSGTAFYYLLEQKDGSILMAEGTWYSVLSSSFHTHIQWVWKLANVNNVECSISAPGHITNLGALGWYPEGFDFDYGSLPSATVYGSAQLLFHVEETPETLTVEEHYYAKRGDAATIDKELHTLTPNEYGEYVLDIGRRDNYDDYAIYYVAHDGGKYVIRIDFPFAADTTHMTAETVEALFAAEHPDAVTLDSAVAFDGKYEVVGVVLYQERPGMLHLAYVKEGGWSQTVGLGSGESPLTAVDDPQLTYLGNGTVTWLCQSSEGLLRYRMDYSLSGDRTDFRASSAPADQAFQGYYITDQCLYTSPYSSTLYPDGDDGNRYFLYNDTFVVTDRESGASDTYSVDWAWDDDPFALGSTEPIPLLRGDHVHWQNIYPGLALAQAGGQLYLVRLNVSMNAGPEVRSIFTLIHDTGYIPPTPLLSAITEVLRDAPYRSAANGTCTRSHFTILDTRELMYDSTFASGEPAGGKLTVVDLVVLSMDFHMVEGVLTSMGEQAYEMTLSFKETDGGYLLSDKDGTLLPDLGDYNALPLYQGCYAQAISTFNVDTDAAIQKLFDEIQSSPAASSDPADYISAHGYEWTELKCYGSYTLRYLFARFLNGGETGLQGHLMRHLLDEMAPESQLRLSAATGQEYFDAWFQTAQNIRDTIGIARMEHEYPAAWLALGMAAHAPTTGQ